MLKVIYYKNISKEADLFYGQFMLRHREFVERQQYDVKAMDGMEFDQYDSLASVYLVYSEDGKTVLGCSRLTPVAYGCMLADLFPGLVDDKSIFDRSSTWEGTRFCVDSRLSPERRHMISQQISLGYLEYALAESIDTIIGLMPTIILRSVFERAGIKLDRLGQAQKIGEHTKVQAAAIRVSEAQLASAQLKTGFSNVLGTRSHRPLTYAQDTAGDGYRSFTV